MNDWTERPLLPPRKKDWKKGTPQVGVFLRTKEGGTIAMVHDQATSAEEALVLCLLQGAKEMPAKLMSEVEKWARRNTAEATKKP